jgi:hypothetical protein
MNYKDVEEKLSLELLQTDLKIKEADLKIKEETVRTIQLDNLYKEHQIELLKTDVLLNKKRLKDNG